MTGGLDPPPPVIFFKKKMVFSNAGPNLLENHKAAKPAFNVGRSLAGQRTAIQKREVKHIENICSL